MFITDRTEGCIECTNCSKGYYRDAFISPIECSPCPLGWYYAYNVICFTIKQVTMQTILVKRNAFNVEKALFASEYIQTVQYKVIFC